MTNWIKNDWEKITLSLCESLKSALKSKYNLGFLTLNDNCFELNFFHKFCEKFNLPHNRFEEFDCNQSIYNFWKITNYIVVYPILRNEFKFVRNFIDFDYKIADIFPFSDLFLSELYSLNDYLEFDIEKKSSYFDDNFLNLEWADKEEQRTKIITSENNPTTNLAWLGYTAKQKEIISDVWAKEKSTRWKLQNKKHIVLNINR